MITGEMLIGGQSVTGTDAPIHGINPATGERLDPPFPGGTPADVDQAARLAWAAFDTYRNTPDATRARLLENIAEGLIAPGGELVARVMLETGLPQGRVEGECLRTANQLRLFASLLRQGDWQGVRLDPALPDRTPPRPDLRFRYLPLGPVGVFGASNFPLAFSVAGGDTAAALAAGCPVLVKAHSAHPGTSELVGRVIRQAIADLDLPAGVFALLHGSGNRVGQALVKHEHIKAIGFTGSRRGGMALMALAASRPEPIPVYAEMSSANPVLLLPHALAARAESLATGFAGSLTLGAGQFCTNPGLVFALEGADLERFIKGIRNSLTGAPAQTMLTPGIHAAYYEGTRLLEQHPGVSLVARGQPPASDYQGQAAVFLTDARTFLADQQLGDEVFGASSLVVRCTSTEEFALLLEALEGQLTATLQLDPEDHPLARQLLPLLERKAGRILCNGYPTGVEVCHAMVHGGPFPATSDGRSTSVGSAAIQRFLRPVCYQDLPAALLPDALKDENPLQLRRMLDGRY